MNTYNTKYTTYKNLEDFIDLNNIINTNNGLLQIFSGKINKNKIEKVLQNIKKLLPDYKIIGTTTDGEILDKNVSSNEIILSFTQFEKSTIEIVEIEYEPSSYKMGINLIKKIPNNNKAKVAIIFADGLNTNGETFLRAFQDEINHLTIAGGLAGDNAKFDETLVFTDKGFIEKGAVAAVLYGENLIANTTFNFGWEKIGKEMVVTSANENIVYSIDNIPTYEIYNKYLGKDISDQLPSTGIEFPLILTKNNQMVARAAIGKNEDSSLIFAGNFEVGDKVHLGYGNVEFILDNLDSLYHELSNTPIESLFIYSCMARKHLIGKNIETEIFPLTKLASVSGFFTYGEFFHKKDKNGKNFNQLFNETMTILSLSERSDIKVKIDDYSQPKNNAKIQTIKALSNLVSVTTKELSDLNETLNEKIQLEVKKNVKHELKLLEQAKMASMGEMIGNIAHQWRQPLSIISTAATGIKLQKEMNILSDKLLFEELEVINKSAQYLSETIETFRNFIKQEKVYKKVFLQENIYKSLDLLKATLTNNHIELVHNLDDIEPIFVNIVEGELSQVMINLITNAKDVFKEKEIEEPKIYLNIKKINKKKILITFEDNAGGIDEKIIDKIFEPYFTTKHKSQGTGLGLYMSYKIIKESLKGNLYVKNTEIGAKFFIELSYIPY